MISRIALVLALIVSLSVLGTVAFADDPPDAGGNGDKKTDDKQTDDKQTDDKQTDDEDSDDKGGGSLFGGYFLPMMIGLIVLMLFMSGRGRRKQQARHDQLLGGLKKGDKVRTIGGILGSVVEIRDDEVVLRIDDNANTRMRVTRKAVSGLVVDGKKDDEKGR